MLLKPANDVLQVTTMGTTLTPHVDTLYWQMTVTTHNIHSTWHENIHKSPS